MGDSDIAGSRIRWADLHAIAMLVATAVVVATATAWPLVVAAGLSFALFGGLHYREWRPIPPMGGVANWLTLARLLLVCVAALLVTRASWHWLFVLFAANVILDVLDGYVARSRNQTTAFGAELDGSVDAFFVLVAYTYFYLATGTTVAILLPGLLPYVHRLLVRAREPIVRQSHAVRMAGINFALLLFAVAAPAQMRPVILIASAVVVTASFAISLLAELRNRSARTFHQ